MVLLQKLELENETLDIVGEGRCDKLLAIRQSTSRLPDVGGCLHPSLGTKLAEIRPDVRVISEKKGKLMVLQPDSITPR